ncbi:MAG: hypothetical protein Sylvanvirus4_40 [Sylvanvirus sp.]|uniref:Uncharacterized protein n=1 Tax=Sylvanvirus sp. TaxID=2487774 RepID=A0A3G5AHJ6_9VIRU|nr:MAG: hypothetical protein Sylvanvirus4_40 [Sylvanvirus sp.]
MNVLILTVNATRRYLTGYRNEAPHFIHIGWSTTSSSNFESQLYIPFTLIHITSYASINTITFMCKDPKVSFKVINRQMLDVQSWWDLMGEHNFQSFSEIMKTLSLTPAQTSRKVCIAASIIKVGALEDIQTAKGLLTKRRRLVLRDISQQEAELCLWGTDALDSPQSLYHQISLKVSAGHPYLVGWNFEASKYLQKLSLKYPFNAIPSAFINVKASISSSNSISSSLSSIHRMENVFETLRAVWICPPVDYFPFIQGLSMISSSSVISNPDFKFEDGSIVPEQVIPIEQLGPFWTDVTIPFFTLHQLKSHLHDMFVEQTEMNEVQVTSHCLVSLYAVHQHPIWKYKCTNRDCYGPRSYLYPVDTCTNASSVSKNAVKSYICHNCDTLVVEEEPSRQFDIRATWVDASDAVRAYTYDKQIKSALGCTADQWYRSNCMERENRSFSTPSTIPDPTYDPVMSDGEMLQESWCFQRFLVRMVGKFGLVDSSASSQLNKSSLKLKQPIHSSLHDPVDNSIDDAIDNSVGRSVDNSSSKVPVDASKSSNTLASTVLSTHYSNYTFVMKEMIPWKNLSTVEKAWMKERMLQSVAPVNLLLQQTKSNINVNNVNNKTEHMNDIEGV